MKSRTSFFNKTVYAKNMTRFAPLWCLYLICLLVGMMMLYTDNGRSFWFASRMGELIQYSSLINLFYAPLAAMLLFGDLFSSRMCNALHAMPVRRETWLVTNILSGLTFSALPTAVMALLSIPLLMHTCVVNAWQIALWYFLGTNLEFVCFFGMAVFSAQCVGSRFGLGLVYAALNGGAFIVYWLVDTLYTPMLYGVVTPDRLADILTPMALMLDGSFIELDNYLDLRILFDGRIDEMVANYWVGEEFYGLVLWAIAGVGFMVLALLLYRRRKLETAGDTIAIRPLEPVFLVSLSVAAAALSYMIPAEFFGYYRSSGIAVACLVIGLAAGWFAGKMLLERTTRVFRPKNWAGLLVLGGVLSLSMAAAYFDVLGIETWTPRAENVKYASIGFYDGITMDVTEEADIENLIRLQNLALEDRLERSGSWPANDTDAAYEQAPLTYYAGGETVQVASSVFPDQEYRYSSSLFLSYTMDSGRTVKRRYYIWTDEEEGDIASKYLSDWDFLFCYSGYREAPEAENIQKIKVSVYRDMLVQHLTADQAQALIAALKADCEAGDLTQRSYFHAGHLVPTDENGNTYTTDDGTTLKASEISLYIETKDGESYYLDLYADSAHTLDWLREQNLCRWEVRPENISGG